MLGATANLSKTSGHALVVGTDDCSVQPKKVLSDIGYHIETAVDPYAAMLELCRRPLVYRAMVLSLQSLYRDELSVITTIRRRFPHVSIWLVHTDGRAATLAEAMRLGAEALISEDGVHPFGELNDAPAPSRPLTFRPVPSAPPEDASESEAATDRSPVEQLPPQQESPVAQPAMATHTNGHSPAAMNGVEKSIDKPIARQPQSRLPTEPVLSAAELRALLDDSAT